MPRPRETSSILSGGAIVLAGIAAYANSFSGPFVFDDVPGIAQNPTLRSLTAALSPPPNGLTVSGRPVLNLSLAINHAFGGDNPWGYHAVNLLIHIAATLALFGILRRTLVHLRQGSDGRWQRPSRRGFQPRSSFETRLEASSTLALVIALIWEVHPLQTESVTYVIQRAESLMGMFYLLSVYFFILYAASAAGRVGWTVPRTPSVGNSGGVESVRGTARSTFFARFALSQWIFSALSVTACLLAMGTKEVAVSIPVIVFLYDRTFISGSFAEAWRRRRGYYAALAATWILLAWEVAGVHGRGGTAGFGTGVPWTFYLLTQFKAIVHYLSLAVWPHPLAFDYARHLVTSPLEALPCAVLLAALALASIWALASKESGRRGFGFAGVWFFLILAPSSSVVPVVTEVVAEHRMYLALIPVIAVIVCAARFLAPNVNVNMNTSKSRRSRIPAQVSDSYSYSHSYSAAAVAAAAVFLCLTACRNTDYRTEEALWKDTVSKQPDDALARYNFGVDLLRRGDAQAAKAEFKEAVRLAPDYADAYVNLGSVLQQEGNGPEAIAAFERALDYKPGSAEAHDDLGIALANAGRLDQAVAEFQAAVRLNPEVAGAHANLAGVLVNSGHVQEGIDEFQTAIRIDPGFAQAHYNLGQVLQALGRGDEARAELEEAARLQNKSDHGSP